MGIRVNSNYPDQLFQVYGWLKTDRAEGGAVGLRRQCGTSRAWGRRRPDRSSTPPCVWGNASTGPTPPQTWTLWGTTKTKTWKRHVKGSERNAPCFPEISAWGHVALVPEEHKIYQHQRRRVTLIWLPLGSRPRRTAKRLCAGRGSSCSAALRSGKCEQLSVCIGSWAKTRRWSTLEHKSVKWRAAKPQRRADV